MARGEDTPAAESQTARAAVALKRIRAKRLAEYRAMMQTGFIRCAAVRLSWRVCPCRYPRVWMACAPAAIAANGIACSSCGWTADALSPKAHRVLHFAPEGVLKPLVQALAGSYDC